MNLKIAYCYMTWFSFFIDIIDNQIKGIEPTSWHPKVKNGNDYCSFNKGRKNMPFYGLFDHVRDYLIWKNHLLENTTWPYYQKTNLLSHMFMVKFKGQYLLILYKVKSLKNVIWIGSGYLYITPLLKKLTIEIVISFFLFL
jgi:hypothetical protein